MQRPFSSAPLQENLDKGLAYVERGVVSAVRRGKFSKKAAEAVKTLLTPSLRIADAKDCDMVQYFIVKDKYSSKNQWGL